MMMYRYALLQHIQGTFTTDFYPDFDNNITKKKISEKEMSNGRIRMRMEVYTKRKL